MVLVLAGRGWREIQTPQSLWKTSSVVKLLGKNVEDHTNGETQDREIRSKVSKMERSLKTEMPERANKEKKRWQEIWLEESNGSCEWQGVVQSGNLGVGLQPFFGGWKQCGGALNLRSWFPTLDSDIRRPRNLPVVTWNPKQPNGIVS